MSFSTLQWALLSPALRPYQTSKSFAVYSVHFCPFSLSQKFEIKSLEVLLVMAGKVGALNRVPLPSLSGSGEESACIQPRASHRWSAQDLQHCSWDGSLNCSNTETHTCKSWHRGHLAGNLTQSREQAFRGQRACFLLLFLLHHAL